MSNYSTISHKTQAEGKLEKIKTLNKMAITRSKQSPFFFHVLFHSKILLQEKAKFIHLFWVWKSLGDAFLKHTPLEPCNQLGALCLYAEVSNGLIGQKPAVKCDKIDVYEPKALSPKISLVPKLSFQQFKDFQNFLLGCFLFFSLCGPYILPSFI